MNGKPLISICIPAYKRIEFLKRLLDSIHIQTFKDYEVVVTDDSPDNTVEEFISHYADIPTIHYFRNKIALGTPENWNEGMRKASGQWIKLMHDDDWFTHETSLRKFYDAAQEDTSCSFLFSAFQNIDEERKLVQKVYCDYVDLLFLRMSPLHLFKKVYIGNPSCTMVRKDLDIYYDKNFKWVVDFEYYIRCLEKTRSYHYIDDILLNIGFNKDQVTNSCFRVAEVEIPECHQMLEKFGVRILRNIIVYDYYWRLYRNLGIRNEKQLARYYNNPIHPILRQLLRFQEKISPRILKIGLVSKTLMFGNYLVSLFRKT